MCVFVSCLSLKHQLRVAAALKKRKATAAKKKKETEDAKAMEEAEKVKVTIRSVVEAEWNCTNGSAKCDRLHRSRRARPRPNLRCDGGICRSEI